MTGTGKEPGGGRAVAAGAAILLATVAVAAAILWGAPPLAALVVTRLDPAIAGNAALVDTGFNILVFGSLLAAALGAARLDGFNAAAFGAAAGQRAASGAGLGAVGMAAAVVYARIAGTLTPGMGAFAGAGVFAVGLAVVLLQATAEEVFFRGWLQRALCPRWGTLAAIGASALAFALLHAAGGTRAPLSFVNLLLGGLMFGLLALRGGGIALPVGTHFAWNATEQLGFGLDPNPGIGSFGALRDWDLAGATAWGGGVEGLNASVGMTVVLLAIVVPLLAASERPILALPVRRYVRGAVT